MSEKTGSTMFGKKLPKFLGRGSAGISSSHSLRSRDKVPDRAPGGRAPGDKVLSVARGNILECFRHYPGH